MGLILKYAGTKADSGLNLTATIIDENGDIKANNISMVEQTNTSLFLSSDLLSTGEVFENGLVSGNYLIRILGQNLEQRGAGVLEWAGVKSITLNDLDKRIPTLIELMQWRDALGIDGDKTIAKNGQLQKKSESPYNNIIDTNYINK